MKVKNWCRQWAWMVGIWIVSVAALGLVFWIVSVAALGLVSMLFRVMMTAAGLKS
ncbi:DUF2474 family protein [Vibrio sp. Y42_MX_L11]|uniref:DUF2474 family protein n=1 Tax=Vibrio sp. Y42_MX_L11 TaxID=2957765 RepID=UPI0020A32529|nr:DUF2474 family protein [Vibrio sp. Y42_MX_L11]